MTFDLTDFSDFDSLFDTLNEVFGEGEFPFLESYDKNDLPDFLTLDEDRVVDEDHFKDVLDFFQLPSDDQDIIREYWLALQIPMQSREDIHDYLRTAQSKFMGEYEDGGTFAAEYMSEDIPSWAFRYMNWDKVWDEDRSYYYAITNNGYVFSNQ